jgi:superfamily I DNA/RNA helicase
VQVVHDLLNGNWFGPAIEPLQPEQIGILYRLIRKENRGIIEDFRASLAKLDRGVESLWLTENTDSKRRIAEPGIKIMTIHAAKGLQFRAVIMLFSHECPADFSGTDEAEERSLFYVGLTRPEDYLVISSSGTSKFISEIEASDFIAL